MLVLPAPKSECKNKNCVSNHTHTYDNTKSTTSNPVGCHSMDCVGYWSKDTYQDALLAGGSSGGFPSICELTKNGMPVCPRSNTSYAQKYAGNGHGTCKLNTTFTKVGAATECKDHLNPSCKSLLNDYNGMFTCETADMQRLGLQKPFKDYCPDSCGLCAGGSAVKPAGVRSSSLLQSRDEPDRSDLRTW